MEKPASERFYRVLDPMDRISEVLFGLIMALTFTGAVGVATADHAEVRTMLFGALGCNLAWGIIDGGMFLMARLNENGRSILMLKALHESADAAAGRQAIAEALPPLLASAMSPDQLEIARTRLQQMPWPSRSRLTRNDALGATAVCLLVFLSTFPIVLPFMFLGDARLALRVSNGVAIVMMFICGYAFGRCAGLNPWVMGASMIMIGATLAGVAAALGG